MEHRIEVKPEFKLIGYELRTSHKDGNNSREIPAFWQRYLNESMGARIPNRIHVDPCVELGICINSDYYLIRVSKKATYCALLHEKSQRVIIIPAARP